MTAQTELLSTEKAAQRLGIKASTLSKWRCNRKYKLAFIKVGGRVAYRPADIDAFIESRRVIPGDLNRISKRGGGK